MTEAREALNEGARELDIQTVAVYSQADSSSLHALFADESVCVGPPPGEASYRNIANIISPTMLSNPAPVVMFSKTNHKSISFWQTFSYQKCSATIGY